MVECIVCGRSDRKLVNSVVYPSGDSIWFCFPAEDRKCYDEHIDTYYERRRAQWETET